MARTKKTRTICAAPCFCRFSPTDLPSRGTLRLTFDEYEVLRLHDLEHMTQEEVARQMQVSRPTVTEILITAHEKMAAALCYGRQIVLERGECEVCEIGKQCPKASAGTCSDKHRCGAVCRNRTRTESQ